MRRMLCLCNTYLLYTRVIQKDRVYPILNNWYDDKSKMKTMVEDRRSSRRLGDYWWSWLGCTSKMSESVGDCPDVLGDRWICGVLGASGFVQTQDGLVNGLCVWHRMVCLCGMLRCKWSRLLLKSKVLWLMIKARPVWRSFVYNVNSRASHPGMDQREKDPGRACISF